MSRGAFPFLTLVLISFIGSISFADPCCGLISSEGKKLSEFLDQTHVDRLWLNGRHVNWKTGEPDKPPGYHGKGVHTHCSAFVAAAARDLKIYVLRPPEHSQELLANAQSLWLGSSAAEDRGWHPVSGMKAAQSEANKGELVLVVFQNPNSKKPGHIAIVRPSEKSEAELEEDGPQIIQAGGTNYLSTTVHKGFGHHKGAWPDGVKYYEHSVH